ncbi:MAG TPA: FHA domain-containing protein [Kofleriaceae bacterium]|nr:FHA domain-containing protein [Kofleriaceae bacterium]
MVAKVLWRDAQGIEGAVELGAGEIKIGRAMDCAIRTDDAMVSRHHARLLWGGGGYVLEDLGSANGIFFQEQKVQSHLLKHGDAVRCGSLWLRYVDTAQLGQPVAEPASPSRPVAPPPQQPPPSQQPMMQHPGIGPTSPHGPTGHAMNAVSPQQIPGVQPLVATPDAAAAAAPSRPAASSEADEEIRRLRRRIEQLQAELRVYRGGKHGADKARKMEDLENDMASMEVEVDRLRTRVKELEDQQAREGGSVKVQRAVEIRGKAAEIVTALNDVLSSLRIEVMAAEGEFDQYSHTIPRASFELIRQSMKEAASNVDQARDLLRQLREVAS